MKILIKGEKKHDLDPLPEAAFKPSSGRDDYWYNRMEHLHGRWIDVETEHLFTGQFNTAPIAGVSNHGMRIMASDVVDVKDDERIGQGRCSWCGKVSKNYLDCPGCGKTDIMMPFVLVEGQTIVCYSSGDQVMKAIKDAYVDEAFVNQIRDNTEVWDDWEEICHRQ